MTSEKPEASLREKVARTAFEIEVGYAPDDRAWGRASDYWLSFADRLLAIPEIAEALELMDEESPVHVSPEERDRLQREKNRQLRSLVDQVKSP